MVTTPRATRILFICHGNICRSPMAEFVMKDLARRHGAADRFVIASAATSTEEIGNDIHPGTKRALIRHDIPFEKRGARQLQRGEMDAWDLFIGMDEENMRGIKRILGPSAASKAHKLLEFCGRTDDVADPWYTGDFETTYRDVFDGCAGLLENLLERNA